MWRNLIKCLLLGSLAIAPLGCEPNPVVVEPDGDDTTIVEERDTIVYPERDAGVDVNVGGERGIDVGVGETDEPDRNP